MTDIYFNNTNVFGYVVFCKLHTIFVIKYWFINTSSSMKTGHQIILEFGSVQQLVNQMYSRKIDIVETRC